ncbi:MAG TPA: tetratricopeptide repeat protein [Chitinivibrionales bacterium]|nr:tetratricopeptide repeat protein [Chitinivibrionales bacterium]
MPKSDASIKTLESKLSQSPSSLVFSRLADRYRKNGEFEQAISVCEEGLKSHPDSVTARVILGRCYLEQEKHQEAIAELTRAAQLDRRNQVAVKLIADLFAAQGEREKAGDLYAWLLRMDPDNKPLIKLSATFRGPGETNIQNIIGQGSWAPQPAAEEEFSVSAPSDVIVDADRTIQMDRIPLEAPQQQDSVDFGEMLVKTQQFDAAQLGAAPEQAVELGMETSETQGGVVTGDDISSRMDTLFGEPEAPAPAAPAEAPEEPVTEVAGKHEGAVTGDDVSSRLDTLFGEPEAPPVSAEPEPPAAEVKEITLETVDKHEGNVTGDDISSRMDSLFGETGAPAVAAEADAPAEIPVQVPEPSESAETLAASPEHDALAETLAGEPGPETFEHVDIGADHGMTHIETSAQTRADAKDDWVVSANDISSRLEQLFGQGKPEAPEDLGPEAEFTQAFETEEIDGAAKDTQPKTSLFTAPTQELKRDELRPMEATEISAEDVTSRLNAMFEDAPAPEPLGQDTDLSSKPAVETEEAPVFDVASSSSASSATEEIKVPDADKAAAEPAGHEISGDDVAQRLETILGDGEEEAGHDSAGTDVIPAEKLETPRSEEETKHPLAGADRPIIVGDEDLEGGAETIIAPRAKLSRGKTGDMGKEPAPAIDDMEEEDASPGMSGDDVAERLDKIFLDSVTKGRDETTAGPGAGLDKEDDAVTQAFRPGPEENAKAKDAETDKTMPPAPGDEEEAVLEVDTLDMGREPEEKTVLMDEDAGGETMAAEEEIIPPEEETMLAEEETILASGRDPFLPKPAAAPANIDESEKDETVRAAKTPAAGGDIFKEELQAETQKEPGATKSQEYDIPDHVLTPTLADIYFQQGQPQLALQIYRRLLSADPDNERMAKRIAEIERSIETQEAEETVAVERAKKKTASPKEPAAPSQEKKPKKSSGQKPLAGVRIKRKYKAKRKKIK